MSVGNTEDACSFFLESYTFVICRTLQTILQLANCSKLNSDTLVLVSFLTKSFVVMLKNKKLTDISLKLIKNLSVKTAFLKSFLLNVLGPAWTDGQGRRTWFGGSCGK